MKSTSQANPRQLSLFDDRQISEPASLPGPVAAGPIEQPSRKFGPPPITSGRAPPETLTAAASLADVLATLEADPAPDRRRRDTKSAFRRMGRVLRRPLVDLPADPARLRPLLAKATPAGVGMSKACWSRVRSLVHAALREFGIDAMPGRDVGARSEAWSSLVEHLPTQAQRLGLSAFVSHCSRRGVEPGQVDLTTFASFRAALETRNRKREPDAAYRSTVSCWNKAVAATPVWPQLTIELKAHPRFYSLEWSAFPESFLADVEAFLTRAANRDEFSDDYAAAVRPGTVELRRRQLRQLATVCMASGVPAETLTSLSVLVDHGKDVLKAERDRQGKLSVSLSNKAWLLCAIARYWVKDIKAAAALKDVAGRLDVKQKGMTERNRDQLRQFDLPDNVTALLGLPDKVARRAATSKAGTIEDARSVMLALAVELLTVAPMRIDNLTNLDVERHVLEFGRGRRRNRHIHIPGGETKTGAVFEVILPARTVALMDVYLSRYRHLICPGPSPYLFPGPGGRARATTRFATAICQFVERETGLKVHVHLFRQIAGKLYLAAHPEGIETVRQILQHSSSATTARYYVEHKISEAFHRYDATLSAHRQSGARLQQPLRKNARSAAR